MEIKNSITFDLSNHSDYLQNTFQGFIKSGLKKDIENFVKNLKFIGNEIANFVKISSFRYSAVFIVIVKVKIPNLSDEDEKKIKEHTVEKIQEFIDSIQDVEIERLGLLARGMHFLK